MPQDTPPPSPVGEGVPGAAPGSIPHLYERGMAPVMFAAPAAAIARRVAALAPRHVLETAAGTGLLTRALRPLLPADASLTATDTTAAMLAVAQAMSGPDAGIAFQQADAQALPFADASFDAVLCQFGVMFFPDRARAHAEALRVLAPGGHYLFTTWDSLAENPFARASREVLAGFFAGDPPGFDVPFACHDQAALLAELAGAGFTAAQAEVVRLPVAIPDAGLFAAGLIGGNPLINLLRKRGADPAPITAALAARLRQEFGEDPGSTILQLLAFTAQRP